jgi:co-chaperonin GroES (HSP10)
MEVIDNRTSSVGAESTVEIPLVEGNSIAEVDRVYSDPTPIRNYVLVRQGAKETFYAGTRFAIPETAQQSPNKGVVVAVGPELLPTETAPGPVKPGDVVTFSRFNAEPIAVDGEVFQLVRFTDIKLVESVSYAIGAR